MEFAALAEGKGGYFPVRVESGQDRLLAQYFPYTFHFLLDALLEHQLAADATDEEGQLGGDRPRQEAGPRRAGGAVDQPVAVGLGEPRMGPSGNAPRKGQALLLFVNRQYGAHQRGCPRARPHAQGKQQAGGGQTLGMFAQVLLIESERRAAVQLKEDIAFGARHQPLGTEGVPTTQRTEANLEPASVQADGSNGAFLRNAIPEYQCFAKARAITRQTARHGDTVGQVFSQAANQVAAVDAQAV